MNSLHQSGIGISQNVIQLVQETVGDEMTESVAQLLVELGSGKLALADLIPFPSIVKNSPKRTQKFIEFVKSNKLEEALKEKEVRLDKVYCTRLFRSVYLTFGYQKTVLGLSKFRLH